VKKKDRTPIPNVEDRKGACPENRSKRFAGWLGNASSIESLRKISRGRGPRAQSGKEEIELPGIHAGKEASRR